MSSFLSYLTTSITGEDNKVNYSRVRNEDVDEDSGDDGFEFDATMFTEDGDLIDEDAPPPELPPSEDDVQFQHHLQSQMKDAIPLDTLDKYDEYGNAISSMNTTRKVCY